MTDLSDLAELASFDNYLDGEDCQIGILVGQTIKDVYINRDRDVLLFVTSGGDVFKMYHQQCCCESVTLKDVCGDFDDLIDSPILVAESVEGSTAQPDNWESSNPEESYTWTFYKIDTAKGGVTLRWFGSSNGYYSESVDFVCVKYVRQLDRDSE